MWRKVLKADALAEGSGKVVFVEGLEVAVFMVEEKVYAMENVCPHRGGPLGEGSLDGFEVICPWHAWAFDVRTGACRTVDDISQKTYSAKIEAGDIYIET